MMSLNSLHRYSFLESKLFGIINFELVEFDKYLKFNIMKLLYVTVSIMLCVNILSKIINKSIYL